MCIQLSSIAKKQTVAITGLLLIIYLIAHLAGNLLIFAGPEAFNGYAKKLSSLGPLLLLARISLFTIFFVHVYFTVNIVLENIKARGGANRYAVDKPVGHRSLAARLMPLSGLYILGFIIWHVLDFTLSNHEGQRSMINGHSYGLYGVVYNSFKDPTHSLLYVIAVSFVGLHLAHGIESCVQTFGKYMPRFIIYSRVFAFLLALGFSSIPLYIFLCR